MARKVFQVLPVALLAAVLAVPLASAAKQPATASGPSKQEARAMVLRGLALDRIYHLGPYASGPSKQELRAMNLRGLALDRVYHLGPYASATGSSFQWGDAGIGSAATLGAILLGLAAVVAVRKRGTALAA
jgi:hypothetical protein